MPVTIAAIAAGLGVAARRFDIDILPRCDSTNSVVLCRAEAGAPSGTLVVAEEQTAGRGRRGRTWFASPGDSLTFSLLWRFAPGTPPAGLSLAVGVAVGAAVDRFLRNGGTTTLKWPNDILLDGRKLGGILVELVPGAAHAAVIGIGINLGLPAAMPADLRAASAAISTSTGTVDENEVLAALLSELLTTLETFAAEGFAAIRPAWMARQAWRDQRVSISTDFGPSTTGVCRGVDSDGALLLDLGGRVERILSGEVSLRPA